MWGRNYTIFLRVIKRKNHAGLWGKTVVWLLYRTALRDMAGWDVPRQTSTVTSCGFACSFNATSLDTTSQRHTSEVNWRYNIDHGQCNF